jgi:hypothetical protein
MSFGSGVWLQLAQIFGVNQSGRLWLLKLASVKPAEKIDEEPEQDGQTGDYG